MNQFRVWKVKHLLGERGNSGTARLVCFTVLVSSGLSVFTSCMLPVALEAFEIRWSHHASTAQWGGRKWGQITGALRSLKGLWMMTIVEDCFESGLEKRVSWWGNVKIVSDDMQKGIPESRCKTILTAIMKCSSILCFFCSKDVDANKESSYDIWIPLQGRCSCC